MVQLLSLTNWFFIHFFYHPLFENKPKVDDPKVNWGGDFCKLILKKCH